MSTTSTVFGDELHRYSIADGIRDKNVLGFDPYKVCTYKDSELRKAVALDMANAATEDEALADKDKSEIYYEFMDNSKVKMTGYKDEQGNDIKGIEDYVPKAQYQRIEHKNMVVKDIVDNWNRLSHANKFHAIFATSSIPDAIEYYRLLKKAAPKLNITALFDPNIDNGEQVKMQVKTDGLVELMTDYNQRYDQHFDLATHAQFKKDIAARLAHKAPYKQVEGKPELQLNLLIVVDQMLTGFDSKWINTLYMDKVMEYENIIQAFSRTNRLFGNDKRFGTIRYYRYPNTMEDNIKRAVKLYSGETPIDLFVEKLPANLMQMNATFVKIKEVFEAAGVSDFTKLPDDVTERGKFAKLFKEFNTYLDAALVQGFVWEQGTYEFGNGKGKPKTVIDMLCDKAGYDALLARYKELAGGDGGNGGNPDVAYEIDGYLTEIDTGRIDTDYMNTRFDKYLKNLYQPNVSPENLQQTLDDLHKSFAFLNQEDQKYANIFLHDVESGSITIAYGKIFMDYVTEYRAKAKNDQVHAVAVAFDLDEEKLRKMMEFGVSEDSINEYGRFDELKGTVDKAKARSYFEAQEGNKISPLKVNVKIEKFLRSFILDGGFDMNGKK